MQRTIRILYGALHRWASGRGCWEAVLAAGRWRGLFRRRRANTRGGNDAGTLQDGIEPVGGQISKGIGFAGWPEDFYPVDLGGRIESEVQTQVVLREVTAAAMNLIGLSHAAGSHFDACADGQAVALRTRQLETDPMPAGNAVISQNHGSAVDVAHDDVHVAIIK